MKRNSKNIFLILVIVALFLTIAYYLPQFSETKLIEINSQDKDRTISIVINVLDKNYEVKSSEGKNLYEAMVKLQNENQNFSFKAKHYSTLGFFVEEINQIKNQPKAYWLYYVNGEKAEVGISNYFPKSGDIINWQQE